MDKKVEKPCFQVNMYDSDGDASDTGIWLWFGDNIAIKVAADLEDWKGFCEHIKGMTHEIEKNH